MSKKIAIVSEFLDYYDHAFDSILFKPEIVWKRTVNNGIKRRDIFKTLDTVGLLTPLHGIVDKVVEALKEEKGKELIIYTDEYAHCGNGKIKLPVSAAMEWSGCYCSEYIESQNENATSYRILRIGNKSWLLRYIGYNSWMSNSAKEVDIEVLSALRDIKTVMRNSPMLAIDYVIKDNVAYYIDINTAPGLKWTGIEDILKPQDVYELVVDYYSKVEADNDWDKFK